MSNLPTLIALEKLVSSINYGNAKLDLKVHKGKIVSIITTGTKKTLYNSSAKDINTNQTAFEYIVKRLMEQVQSGISAELTFRVQSHRDKIKSVEVESVQSISKNPASAP
jgi:hypothetical protein